MTELQRSEPLSVQIYRHYKQLIATGDLAPGDQLPPIRRLMDIHGVALATAARAVDLLAAEKLVTTHRGNRGTIVTDTARVAPPRLLFGPQQRLGWGPIPGERTEVTSAGMTDAPPHVAARFQISSGEGLDEIPRHQVTPVYRREQLTYGPDGQPSRLEVSWFHPRWAEIIPALASDTIPISSLGGVAWLIAQASSDPIVRGADGIEARPVLDDGREAPLLRLGPGTVILAAVYEWQVRNPRDELETIEYGEYIIPQGRVIEHEYAVGQEE